MNQRTMLHSGKLINILSKKEAITFFNVKKPTNGNASQEVE